MSQSTSTSADSAGAVTTRDAVRREAVIALEGVTRSYGPTTALRSLDLEVRAGELYGLVGPDGAGKTTCIRAIAGLLLPDAGDVKVFGVPPTRPDVRERLGLMPQQYSLYGDLSVGENLHFFARLNALPRAVFRERSERLLAITRLAPFLKRRADALSGGMYKKLALACALLHQPDVLLLDEPTNGVDPVSRRELWALLYEFVERGMSILISTPYMDEAERCHRVGLLHHGELLIEGEPATLLGNFEQEVYEVMGGQRDELDQVLGGLDAVLAASPAGSRLRIVIERGGRVRVSEVLAGHGAQLAPVIPTFEDVYLAHLQKAAA